MTHTNGQKELPQSVGAAGGNSPLCASQASGQELYTAKEELRRSYEQMQHVLDGIADGIMEVDAAFRLRYVNRKAETLFGLPGQPSRSLIGRELWDVLPEMLGTDFERAYRRAAAEHVAMELEAFYPPRSLWLAVRVHPASDGLSLYFQDVTRRKEAEARLASERAVLEMIVAGAPLPAVLERLAAEAESQSLDGMLCAILTCDESGERLLLEAAPSLPAKYRDALHGLCIGPAVSSCGPAAFAQRPMCVPDIAAELLRADHQALAADHGLRACSSTPVLSSKGAVLGAVAAYYRRPHQPSARDAQIIELTSRLASIAIERRNFEEALRRSEQVSRSIIESSRDCIKRLTLDGLLVSMNDAGQRALCIDDLSPLLGRPWIDSWNGEDREKARSAVQAAAAGGSGSFVGHFPVAGVPRWWDVVVSPVCDRNGVPESLLAVSREVTERVAADRKLRESEAELRHLANLIPHLAWMAEPDGNIFWYNEGWYQYTGTTFAQMQGWGWQSLHDPDMLPKVVERWCHSLATGEPFDMEFPLRGKDGVFRWFLTRVNPMRDSSGRVVRWFGTNTDVDQVKRIRHALEEETRMLELLNRTGITLASNLDQQSLLQAITDAATQLSGAQFGAFFYNLVDENGEAYMLHTLSGAPRELFEKLGHPRSTALFGPTFRGEGIIRCDDVLTEPRYGQMAPYHGMPPGHLPVRSYLAVPVTSRSGEVLGGLFFGHSQPGVFSQRSERLVASIAAQAAVAVDNARLYEAAQRSAEERKLLLESERHARAAAEHASRMKDEFLATLSHELRTPLSAILGWSQVLRMRPPSEEELRRGLDTIERNARVQTQLIEDLLDMSRITSGKVQLDVQPVQPISFVEAALETVRPTAEARGIRLEQLLDPAAGPVMGDQGRLQQVVWNLLNNAIKFTPQDGTVQVRLGRVDAHVEISVTDTGVGIAPQFLEHVFERFRQADASITRQFGGLGLGLSIVSHLVELHGGSVQARSEGHNRGATFIVRLPLASPQRSPQAEERHEPPRAAQPVVADFRAVDLSNLKVLVVDDQADSRELVARVLSECQATVLIAKNAAEALLLVERERPDVLVSDIGMPDIDGFELLKRVRALGEERGGRTPAIALTAFARPEDRCRALHRGFQVHVSKPVKPAELAATVASLAGRPGRR